MVILAFGLFCFISDYKCKDFVAANATIVEVKNTEDGIYGVSYEVDGQIIKVDDVLEIPAGNRVGDVVDIRYNPNNYNDIIYGDSGNKFIIPIIGGLFLIFGLLNLFRIRRFF